MSATQTLVLRSSVVSGMVVAVVTVLYFTPMPEHHFKSCERPCHDLDWPMICRIKLRMEAHHTLGPWWNGTAGCKECHGDVVTANRQVPGPAIHVCENDVVVVDVWNQVSGHEVSVHWRGQPQRGTACMDGVPMVSQCALPSHTAFQYKFRASGAGTHLWHAFSNVQRSAGVLGALVVRQAQRREPHRRLYDRDEHSHTLVITEWSPGRVLLINGRHNHAGKHLTLKPGLRYRFRVVYASGKGSCPVRLFLDQHRLRVIALDGHPIVPHHVSALVLGPGERADFIVYLNKPDTSSLYTLQVQSECEGVQPTLLHLQSDETSTIHVPVKTSSNDVSTTRILSTDLCVERRLDRICLNHVRALHAPPAVLRVVSRPVHTLYFALQHGAVNNITFTFPSSPLQTQLEDVEPESLCKRGELPERCDDLHVCHCVHVEQVPLGQVVEILLIDTVGTEHLTYHIHGYSFYVVGHRQFSSPMSLHTVQKLDQDGELFERDLKTPPLKDTIRVPVLGVVALRFIADNPGFWLVRDEGSQHWSRGMDFVLQVGTPRDFPNTPANLPTCGNWIGPEFFLA